MDMQPLSVRVSNLPKPVSRIPMPGRKRPAAPEVNKVEKDVIPLPGRKRLAAPEVINMEKENASEPITKKAKLSSSITESKKPMAKAPATKRPLAKATTSVTSRAKATASITSRTKPKPGPSAAKVPKTTTSQTTGKETAPKAAPGSSATAGGKQKRSPWDLKGRLQDMEARMTCERQSSSSTIETLSEQLSRFSQRLDHLESVRVEQEGTIRVKQEETHMASQRIQTLESELNTLKSKYKSETESYQERVETLERRCMSQRRDNEELERNLSTTRSTLSQLMADMSTIQSRYDVLKLAKDSAVAESARKSEVIASLEEDVQRHLATIAEGEARIREDEMTRRKLHNTIQELRGNIRVFCRVRPSLPGEAEDRQRKRSSVGSHSSSFSGRTESNKRAEAKLQIEFPDSNRDCKKVSLEFSSDQTTATGVVASPKSYSFEFDHTFGPATTQDEVFTEISQLVQSALDGYNVCIFAYGQTGSGKTFTMEGPEHKPHTLTAAEGVEILGDSRGMIPRAMEQIFQNSLSLREQGWEYKLEASFLEIYNETIRDLLSSSSSSSSSVSYDIKMDPAHPGCVYVTNVSPVLVTSQEQVAGLLMRATQNRAVAATNCNERSSRSHSVFILNITGTNKITEEKCRGSLNLIDLAGSERLAQSGSVGERLKETKNINKSLSNLGQVIMALSNKDQHIPYRNSKLTYLLQNSLGGNSKTLMFVNMSPMASCFQESLCSLRFATKVNECNIGTARKTAK